MTSKVPAAVQNMITHCRLPLRFDPQRLAADLELALGEAWTSHFVSENYRGHWNALSLRSAGGSEEDILAHELPADAYRDTPLLQRCGYLRELLSAFHCPLKSVRLMRLGAGSEIKEHSDPGCGYEYGELRLHIPIVTSPAVEFYLDGQKVAMQPGECWYLNFSLPHRVLNAGSADRIHLVIDCSLSPWLDSLFKALDFSALERYGTSVRHLDNNIAGLEKLDTPAARLALRSLQAQKAEIEAARLARGT